MFNKKSSLKPLSLRKRKRKRLAFYLIAWFIALVIVLGGIIYLFRIPQVQISTIDVNGVQSVSADDVKQKALDDMSGNYFLVFPKDNILLYPRKKIQADIATAYPVFSAVSVSLHNFNILTINVTERMPVALWCEGFNPSDACYLMDSTGFIYASAPASPNPTFIRYGGLIDPTNPIDASYVDHSLSTEDTEPFPLADLDQFAKKITAQTPFQIQSLMSEGDGEYQLQTTASTTILFNDRQTLDQTFSNLLTLVSQAGLDATSTPLSTIDLRFGDKIYYKSN